MEVVARARSRLDGRELKSFSYFLTGCVFPQGGFFRESQLDLPGVLGCPVGPGRVDEGGAPEEKGVCDLVDMVGFVFNNRSLGEINGVGHRLFFRLSQFFRKVIFPEVSN